MPGEANPKLESWWRYLRRSIRRDELFLLLLAAIAGALAALGAVTLRLGVDAVQLLTFGLSVEQHPGRAGELFWWRPLAVTTGGGLLFGLAMQALRRWHPREIVDPIEANALKGGRMSLKDSVILALMSVASLGVGASVGLEAAITQLGAGIASIGGQGLALSRSQLRTLVGCGAGAAIAAAFNAPFAGTFYALELVIGGYAINALPPVVVASVTGALVSQHIFGAAPMFATLDQTSPLTSDYLWFALMGVIAALLGVAVMRSVTVMEGSLRRLRIPRWTRPALGGLLLGGIAIFFPHVLGSGHRGVELVMNHQFDLTLLLSLVLAKGLGSAISIGFGFRGGLFSASLFLGALFGAGFATLAGQFIPELGTHYIAYTLVGMGSVAAAIVGAPLTMIMLVFETTTDYRTAIGVATAVIIATVVTKRWFGFSFATWRFHQRGLDLTGAHDVGRIQSLAIREIVNRAILVVPAATELDALLGQLRQGHYPFAFVEDESGKFLGIVMLARAQLAQWEHREPKPMAADLIEPNPSFLTLEDRLATALDVFDDSKSDVIAVMRAADDMKTVGYVEEGDVLRRYFREVEDIRREELGDVGLLSLSKRRVKPASEQA